MPLNISLPEKWRQRGLTELDVKIQISASVPQSLITRLDSARMLSNTMCQEDEQIPELPPFPEGDASVGFEWAFGGNGQPSMLKALDTFYLRKYDYSLSKNAGLARTRYGNIISEYKAMSDIGYVLFTRNFAQPASEFFHDDSCWWGGYTQSRIFLHFADGLGALFYDHSRTLIGRAWIIPYGEYGFVVFNPYGVNFAQIEKLLSDLFSSLNGQTYHTRTEDFDAHRMYVNNSDGVFFRPATSLGKRVNRNFLESLEHDFEELVRSSGTSVISWRGVLSPVGELEGLFNPDRHVVTTFRSHSLALYAYRLFNIHSYFSYIENYIEFISMCASPEIPYIPNMRNRHLNELLTTLMGSYIAQDYISFYKGLRPRHLRRLIVLYEMLFNNRFSKLGKRLMEDTDVAQRVRLYQSLVKQFGTNAPYKGLNELKEEWDKLRMKLLYSEPLTDEQVDRKEYLMTVLPTWLTHI